MRGKGSGNLSNLDRFGITPAYAGKRQQHVFFVIMTKDHPRLCGEKPETYCVKICRTGSPPPMRGKAPFRFVAVARGGITPAYAGKSSFSISVGLLGADHPRLCGEKLLPEFDCS